MAGAILDPVASEILQCYADVLRLGSLRVNGALISWDVDSRKLPEERLASFSEALGRALRAAPGVGQLADEMLCAGLTYWLCKALSINYALSEVLQLVKRRAGTTCSIESWNCEGSYTGAEYMIDLQPGPKLRAGISWGNKGNLVSCDPQTAEKRVNGTISHIETEFALPPACGFAPEYYIEMEVCKASKPIHMPRLFGRLFGLSCAAQIEQADYSYERLVLASPLRHSSAQAPSKVAKEPARRGPVHTPRTPRDSGDPAHGPQTPRGPDTTVPSTARPCGSATQKRQEPQPVYASTCQRSAKCQQPAWRAPLNQPVSKPAYGNPKWDVGVTADEGNSTQFPPTEVSV